MTHAALVRAIERRSLVRIHRSGLVDFHIDGYALSAGDDLVLLQPMRDRLDLDGYDVIRMVDITKVARVPPAKAALYLESLALKGQYPSDPIATNLDSMRALLRSAAKAYPLIVAHREKASPASCEVGRKVRFVGSRYVLDEISPDGDFDRTSRSFAIADVTLVQFDGAYENALAAVAARRAAR